MKNITIEIPLNIDGEKINAEISVIAEDDGTVYLGNDLIIDEDIFIKAVQQWVLESQK